MTFESLTARDSSFHLCEFIAIVMPNRGKGGGKPTDYEEATGPDRRLPREPLGPYNRPFPVDGCPWERRIWADDRRKGKGKGKTTSAGLLEIMTDQLPMLTEKGLRELLISISCELSFRGDVREQNEEIQLEYEANGGKGSAFPPEDLIEIVRSRESREAGHMPVVPGMLKKKTLWKKMNIASRHAKVTDIGMNMVKNNSMRIRPAWACGCMRNSYDWSHGCDMVNLECVW